MNKLLKRLLNAYKSLTMWFNAVLIGLLGLLPYLSEVLPQLQEHLSDATYKHVMLFVLIGNMILRVRTTKDLAEKGQ